MKFYNICFFFCVYLQQCAEGANILGVFPMAGKSSNILYQRLLKGLADVGHDVTSISAYEFELSLTNGSVRDVLLTGFAEQFENLNTNIDDLAAEYSSPFISNYYMSFFLNMYNRTYHHPNVKRYLRSNVKFDAVITEYLWSESILGFAAHFKCPSIVFSSTGGVNVFVNDMVGNPLPSSYVPHTHMLGDYSKGLNFFDRFHNFIFYSYDLIFKYVFSFPAHNQILRSAFPKNPPEAAELYKNVSLVLLGTHSSIDQATPFVPNIIEIGGFHIDPPEELPKDLQKFLDGAKNGAVYFSMGSLIESKNFPEKRKKMFVNIFRKLNMNVIWKFEDNNLADKPSNVLIKKWLPQKDILGHPNIRLFITHGGYGSLLETVYHGVPALMIPVFYDQHKNAHRAQEQGYALKLSYNDKNFSEQTLYNMIRELLDNPKYTENAKAISKLFHDRPMKPMDAAVYWIEYVIRNKGADHLKVAAVKMPFYKLYMLDVILFIIVLLSLVIFGVLLCFRKICRKTIPTEVKRKVKRKSKQN